MSLLDDLIYGLRDVYDATGKLLTRRTKIQFGAGLKAIDNPATGRIEVSATGGGGEGSGIESVATLGELRAIPSAGLGTEVRLVEEAGVLWRYEATTGADEVDDANLSVKPDDKARAEPGRWRPVVQSGKPGIEAGPGLFLPVSYLSAGLQVIGARPVVDGDPAGALLFTGFAVDMGDDGGIKKPSPVLGLVEGAWAFFELHWDTLGRTELYRFGRDGLRARAVPGEGPRRIYIDTAGSSTSEELSLLLEAGSSGSGKGGSVIVKPGKSGPLNARRADAVLATEDGVPVVSATSDENGISKLAFFNASHVAKPVVTGSHSDGSAALSLLDALVALGLVEDQTTP